MKTVWNVFKKEMLNIVRNRRRLFMMILFNVIILPSLAIIPMSMITRKAMKGVVEKLEVPVHGSKYAPELVAYIEKNESMTIVEVEDVEKMVREKQASAGLIIPEDFAQRLQNGESALITVVIDKSKSMNLEEGRLKSILEKYNQIILEKRLEKNDISEEYLTPLKIKDLNTATKQETTGSQLGLLIPGFIMSFGLTSGLSIAIGTIAGEKEEQTLEPVLFTPINRAYLILGKLLAVLANVILAAFGVVFTILFSILTFILILIYFARNMDFSPAPASSASAAASSLPFAGLFSSLPEPTALIYFFVSMLPIILLGAALQIMISSMARNSEEAYTFSLPFNIISLTPMVVSFFLDEFTPALGHYAIPIFGTILSMRDLLSNHIYSGPLLVMFISSIGYAAIAIGISIWMFNREEVVFRT